MLKNERNRTTVKQNKTKQNMTKKRLKKGEKETRKWKLHERGIVNKIIYIKYNSNKWHWGFLSKKQANVSWNNSKVSSEAKR